MLSCSFYFIIAHEMHFNQGKYFHRNDLFRCFLVFPLVFVTYNNMTILQVLPYFVMDIFDSTPGMPGVFLAALFSASLRYFI